MPRNVDNMSDPVHMRHRPDMYIGDVETRSLDTYMYKSQISYGTVEVYNNAIVQLVRELVSNAADQIFHCELEGEDRRIDLNIDASTINVVNYGIPMSIDFNELGKTTGRMIPEICFLDARTGANFTESKTVGVGKNGYGAKLCVVYSKYFCVKIVDVERNRYFEMTCTRNGTKIKKIVWPEPQCIDDVWKMPKSRGKCPHFEDKRSYTSITIEPDFDTNYCVTLDKAMNVPPIVTGNGKTIHADHIFKGIENISKKFRNAIFTHCLGFAMHNIQLRLNNAVVEVQKYSTFISSLYSSSEVLVFKEVKDDVVIRVAIANTEQYMPPFGFVNGLFVNKGMHITSVQTILAKAVAKVKDDVKITASHVKNAVTLCVSIEGPDAKYKNQSKDDLNSIGGRASFTLKCMTDIFDKIKNWKCIKRILQNAEAKEVEIEMKKNVVKVIDGYLPANVLGPKASLLLGEGKSTKSFLSQYRSGIKGGMDNLGLMVGRGVPLNPVGKTDLEIINNAVFKTLLGILKLSFEKTYENDEEVESLRYGSIIIAADADEDGLHIMCLFIALFQYRWPALVSRGFVRVLRTPVVIVYKGSKVVAKYFTEPEYIQDQYKYDDKYEPKYLKGLGASSDDEIKISAETAPVVYILNTEETTKLMSTVFTPNQIAARKKHIIKHVDTCVDIASQFRPTKLGELIQKRYYDNILRSDAVVFSLSAIRRFLPHDRDGLKPGQRMVVAWCLEDSNFGKKKVKSMKVSQLAGKVAADQKYHHGPSSMEGTIMKMAQQYVGRCNMAFLETDGQAGSRLSTDSASNPRYVGVKIAQWVHLAYPKKLYRCIARRNVEGCETEPLFVPCLLPMAIINGTKGIASGWSSTIPAHNPREVLKWLIQRTENDIPTQKIHVWWKDYTGIIKYSKNLTVSTAVKDEDGETTLYSETVARGYIAYGYKEKKGGNIVITEIPPGITFVQFIANLQDLQEKGRFKRYRDDTKGNSPHFTLYEAKSLSYEELMLVERGSLTNLTFMHKRGEVCKFTSVKKYMEYYYNIILKVYEKNKLLEIEKMNETLNRLRQKIKYIKLCLEGFQPTEVSEKAFIKFLKQNNLDLKIVDSIKDRDKTTTNYLKLQAEEVAMVEAIVEHHKIDVSTVYRTDLGLLSRYV